MDETETATQMPVDIYISRIGRPVGPMLHPAQVLMPLSTIQTQIGQIVTAWFAFVDQLRPVIEYDDLHVVGERGQDLIQCIAKAARDRVTVFADPHEAQPQHHFPGSRGSHHPFTNLVPDDDFGRQHGEGWGFVLGMIEQRFAKRGR